MSPGGSCPFVWPIEELLMFPRNCGHRVKEQRRTHIPFIHYHGASVINLLLCRQRHPRLIDNVQDGRCPNMTFSDNRCFRHQVLLCRHWQSLILDNETRC
jgi:hypothetical protein